MSTTFKFFLLLHILSVIVAFAPTVAAVASGSRVAVATARTVYAPALILVGLFGIGAVLSSDDLYKFDQTWISLAFVVWIAMVGVFQAIVMPGRRIGSVSRVEGGQAIMTVLLVVILYLMVWKPGL